MSGIKYVLHYSFLFILIFFNSCDYKEINNEEEKQFIHRKERAETAVSGFIRKYAMYPGSYESLSFSEYTVSYSQRHTDKIPDSENYSIKHTHRLLNKDSILQSFSGYFIMEHDYYISAIEKTRSNSTGGAFPPKTEVWTDEFARPMTEQDSLELMQRSKLVFSKFVKKMKEGIESGDMYSTNHGGLKKIKKLLDTLETEN